MPMPFDRLAAHVPDGGWGTVVWAGIGYGDGLEALRAQGMQQLVALEPHPGLAAWLAASTALGARDDVRHEALWSQAGDQRLFVLNDPLQGGLARPERAMAIRRNLSLERDVTVRATTLDALCEPMADDLQRLLVLDVNGAEQGILEAASDATLLGFAAIAVHVDPLHVADAVRGALASGLAARGFQPVPDATDADGGWLVVARAPDGLPKTALQEEVASLTARIGELEAALSTSEQSAQRTAQLEVELQQSAQRAAQLDAELQQSTQRATQLEVELQQSAERAAQSDAELQQAVQRATQLETELQQSAQRTTQLETGLQESAQHAIHLDSELQKSVQHAAELDAELQQSGQRATQLEAELQQSAQRITQLETGLEQSAQHAIHLDSELQKSVQHAAQLDAELQQSAQCAAQSDAELQQAAQRATQLEAELQQSVQRAAQLESDLQQGRQTVRMAVQMQAQREADLADLQARYRDGQDALEHQHALLDKLGDRLGLASDYFHQLSASADDDQPTPDGATPLGGSGEALAGTARRGSGRTRKAAKPKSRG